jgi:hypothetical protein
MGDAVPNTQQEFWRPPVVLEPETDSAPSAPVEEMVVPMAEVCHGCGSEFMIAARFCHVCGLNRAARPDTSSSPTTDAEIMARLWARNVAWVRTATDSLAAAWREFHFPEWMRYLHFHEIKRWVGLPTGALIAFFVGLGCVAGAIGISLFFKASNLAEFQAIQMWRIEWLLAATASFVAGILLKKPSDN